MSESRGGHETDDSLVDQIIDEVLVRQRRGESPSLHEYVDRFPHLSELLHEIFPTLLVVKQAQPGFNTAVTASNQASEGSLAGQQLGDYLLLRLVGRGGMGAVYEARQISLDRIVGIKVLYQHLAVDLQFVQRFLREAQSAAKLQHPHIVAVYGNGSDNGWYYYAMQLIAGESLDRVLSDTRYQQGASEKQLLAPNGSTFEAQKSDSSIQSPPPKSKEYFRWVAKAMLYAAQAVHYAHSKGIIHRDIKPANLLIDALGELWVTDFGLAKLDFDIDLTRTGDVVGTLRYVAPEQLAGASSPSCDIYGLGITLYELLALRPAFSSKNQAELLAEVRYSQPIRPRTLDATIPKNLETIVLTAIEKDPRDRYSTAAELADDLQRFLDDQPISARNPSTVEQVIRWTRRNKAWAASLLLILVMLGVVLPVVLALFNWRLSREVQRTRLANQQAEKSSDQSQLQLASSLIEQAKWLQQSSLPTRRTDSLTALTQASQALQVVEQRNAAPSANYHLQVDLVSQACSGLALPNFFRHISIPREPFRKRQEALVAISQHAYAVADGPNVRNPMIQVFSLDSHRRLGELKLKAFSAWLNDDGSRLITQSDYRDGESTLAVWSIPEGKQVWQKRILYNCVVVAPQPQSLVALIGTGELLTYDLRKQCVTGSTTLKLVSTGSGSKPVTTTAMLGRFKSMLHSATAEIVALLSDRSIVVVNSGTGRVLRTIKLERKDVIYIIRRVCRHAVTGSLPSIPMDVC